MSERLLNVSYEPDTGGKGSGSDLFARFRFTAGDPGVDLNGRDFETGLPQVGGPAVHEVWRYSGPSDSVQLDGFRAVICRDYLLVAGSAVCGDVRSLSRDLYDRMLRLIRSQGYAHILRAWNSVPDINGGQGEEERYKQFCHGRAEALEGNGLKDLPPPAATAVGSAPHEPLRVFLLAGREPAALLENPRQTSAYRYPREYGPRSPTFSRAALLVAGTARQMFLSGTAAIVGHQSQHNDDSGRQLDVTLENIRLITAAAGLQDGRTALRLYARNPAQSTAALQRFSALNRDGVQTVILTADICRRELLIEVDGVLISQS